MHEAAELTTHAWEGFYVIVGTTAGALTGLQFVVLTLVSEAGMVRGSSDAVSTFSSPNVVHFCAALLVSAILAAPWLGLATPGVAVLLAGVAGFLYSITVLRRARRQRDYKPVLEDWIWHAALPLLAYGALVGAGIQLIRYVPDALYVVAASTLLLVFIGVHNAWDTVMYVTLERARANEAAVAGTRAAGPRLETDTPAETPSGES